MALVATDNISKMIYWDFVYCHSWAAIRGHSSHLGHPHCTAQDLYLRELHLCFLGSLAAEDTASEMLAYAANGHLPDM